MIKTTHVLKCRHQLNSSSCFVYCMKCIILKKMPGQRLKIRVFGDRNCPGNLHKSYIRYVYEERVTADPHI